MTLLIVSLAIALGISFFCSLLEATLLSLHPSQVAEISRTRPSVGATWKRFKSQIDRPIAVILTLNTAAHTIGASVAGAEFDKLYGSTWIWAFSLGLTFVMLQFTEILPKTLGVRFNRELAILIARPLEVAVKVLSPLLTAIQLINRPFERRTGERPATSATIREIDALASMARLERQITAHQERIIKGTSRLSTLCVRDVMLPAEQVSFLSTSQTVTDALITAHIDSHTRYPVAENGDRDRVIGYINFKELVYFMRTNPRDPSLRGVIRPVTFVKPEDSAADLMRAFVDQHEHLAMVRDEEGKIRGLVTFEDIVEELVGEMEDEFDRLPRMLHPLSGGVWMVGGGLSTRELVARLGHPIEGADGTVSAWVAARLGHVPTIGESFRENGLDVTVRRVRRGKAFEVAIRCSPSSGA